MASPDQNQGEISPRPELFDFHGVPMVPYATDNWDNVQKFQAKPDDILIATYPKAGTTWVSQMLDLLYFGKSSPQRGASLPIYERVAFLEFCVPDYNIGVDVAEKLTTSPRLIKTHNPIQFVPKSFWEQMCKAIYVARNAKDNVVSYFHFDRMTKVQPDPGDWPSYLQRFQEGKLAYGSWYDHVIGWWEKKEAYPNLLYLHYEDLSEDIDRELDRVCSFLGLSPTEEEKNLVKEGIGFEAMKKNDMTNYSTSKNMDFSISRFMRKGKVGDWKNHFTVHQNEQFDKEYQKKMMTTALRFRTEI